MSLTFQSALEFVTGLLLLVGICMIVGSFRRAKSSPCFVTAKHAGAVMAYGAALVYAGSLGLYFAVTLPLPDTHYGAPTKVIVIVGIFSIAAFWLRGLMLERESVEWAELLKP